MSFFKSFSTATFKVHLKTAIARMQLQRNKMGNVVKVQKRDIAALLDKGKDESARIKVEHIIREDFLMEALEILELFCELLLARAPVIESQKELPAELAEAVHTLMYASYRVDVQELGQIREDLTLKYGKLLAKLALENTEGSVNPRVINKLATAAPEQFLVLQYLKEIAKQHNIDWQSDWQTDVSILGMPPLPPGGGAGHGGSSGSGAGNGGGGIDDPRLQMLQQPSYLAAPARPEYSGSSPVSFTSGPATTTTGGGSAASNSMPEYYGSAGSHGSLPQPSPSPQSQHYQPSPPPPPPPQEYDLRGPPPPPFGSAPPPLPPSVPVLPPPAPLIPDHTTSNPSGTTGGGDGLPDFDELTRRFEALKKR